MAAFRGYPEDGYPDQKSRKILFYNHLTRSLPFVKILATGIAFALKMSGVSLLW